MGRSVNLLLIEDHRLFGEGLALLLSTRQDLVLLGTVSPGEALERARSLPVDIILITATIPKLEAIRLLLKIKKDLPGVRVMMLGLENQEETILDFIEAGINGYVVKDAPFSELLQTIQAMHEGRTFCSPRIAALVFARISRLSPGPQQSTDAFKSRLSQREREVLRLICAGLSNKEIATRLFISVPTVKNHVHHILTKLEMSGRREAIQYVREHQLFMRSPIDKT